MNHKIIVCVMGVLLSTVAFALEPAKFSGGNISNQLSFGAQRRLAKELRSAMPSSFNPTPRSKLKFKANYLAPSRPEADPYLSYENALQSSKKFINELSAWIYYQASEDPHYPDPLELQNIMNNAQNVREGLVAAREFLEGHDATLESTLRYVNDIEIYASSLGAGIIPVDREEIIISPNAPADSDKFFLKDPTIPEEVLLPLMEDAEIDSVDAFWEFQTATQNKWLKELPLPKQKKVAVVTDPVNPEDKFWIKWMASHVPEFEGWDFTFFENPEMLLTSPSRFGFDMVLTDLIIGNGGGLYLGKQLRKQGFRGAIVAATRDVQTEENFTACYESGFDGMISLLGIEEEEQIAAARAERDGIAPEDFPGLPELWQKLEESGAEGYGVPVRSYPRVYEQALRNYHYYQPKEH